MKDYHPRAKAIMVLANVTNLKLSERTEERSSQGNVTIMGWAM
jgi:hypothetical protein